MIPTQCPSQTWPDLILMSSGNIDGLETLLNSGGLATSAWLKTRETNKKLGSLHKWMSVRIAAYWLELDP